MEDKEKDNPFTERRVGKFIVHSSVINHGPYDKLMQFMSNFLVVRAEHMWVQAGIEYTAYSHLFGVTDEGEMVPEYKVIVGEDESLSVRRMA